MTLTVRYRPTGWVPGALPASLAGVAGGASLDTATVRRRVQAAGLSPGASSDTAQVSATPAEPSEEHPNEPVGFTFIAERSYNALDEGPFDDQNGSGDACTVHIEADASGPISPGNVLRHTFTPEYGSGSSSSVGKSYLNIPDVSELYVQFAIRIGPNFVNSNSSVNKLFYLTGDGNGPGGGDPLFFVARGESGTFAFEVMHQNPSLEHAPVQVGYCWNAPTPTRAYYSNELVGVTLEDAELPRGEWRVVEVIIRNNTAGNEDGEIHAWVNETKIFQFTAAEFSAGSCILDNLRVEPIWGGGGQSAFDPPENFWFDLDHIYVSGVS